MINLVMVEDDKTAKERIEGYLEQYAKEKDIEYRLKWYQTAEAFLENYDPSCDIVFLDIDLPQMSGMDCAKALRKTDSRVTLVFITELKQLAVEGYEVDASDFIIKPVSYLSFITKFERLLKKNFVSRHATIMIKSEGRFVRLALNEIYYVDIARHDMVYHTMHGDYMTRGSLRKEEAMLQENNFFRCINYCMVNLYYVSLIKGYTVTMRVGNSGETKEIPIGRKQKADLVRALNNYLMKK